MEVRGTSSIGDWFRMNWPIVAMIGIVVATTVFFGWLLTRGPPGGPEAGY